VKNPASAKRCESCAASKNAAFRIATKAPVRVSFDETPLVDERPRSRHDHHPTPMVRSTYDDDTAMRERGKDHRSDKREETEWECEKCHYRYANSVRVCRTCQLPKPSKDKHGDAHAARGSSIDQPPVHRSPVSSTASSSSVPKIYPDIDDDYYSSSPSGFDRQSLPKDGSTPRSSTKEMSSFDAAHGSDPKSKSSKDKMQPPSHSTPSHQPQPVSVYISDLPLHIDDDDQLASLIRRRIEKTLQFTPIDVKCYSKLGVGVVIVSDNKTKERLIDEVGNLTLQPKDGKDIISFVETLELVSYIVLDISKEKKDFVLPIPEEISGRWAEIFKAEKPLVCENLNAQFPNIYRVVSRSLNQLVRCIDVKDFSIKKLFARIYFCADCSFLEDLPRSITENRLQDAIAYALKQTHISSSSLHIQINKQTGNACVIASDAARKWSTVSFIDLDGKNISKKADLTCHLLVHPVPPTFSIQTILTHKIFAGKIVNDKRSGENLILEISDRNVFDQCVSLGALRVGDRHLLNMEAYVASKNPEGSEINAETWYDTEMPKYKPDIMQFVADPQHFIFRYKWNAKIWLETFERVVATPRPRSAYAKTMHGSKETTPDQIRHQLQVTVMLNTLAVARKRSYLIGDREIKLNLNNNLKTIVYNHQSTLEKSVKMPLKTPPYTKTMVQVVEDDCVVVYEKLLKKGKNPLLLNMASATSPGGGFRKGDGAQEENLFRRSDYFRSLDIGLDDFLPQKSERFHCSSNAHRETLSNPSSMYPMEEFTAIYTSGLTFFRHSQDDGYKYMEKPMENVCSIAMAAYRDPKLEGKLLAPKYAVGTRKKIENIFAIAHHHKHDSLVLSALGCGAFRNPPKHVAELFLSVIDQYAGFFDTIIFAIIDDHNAGHRLNPEGNFKPFADILHNKSASPLSPMTKPNTMFGPYRLTLDGSNVNDVCIFDLAPCNFGAKCRDINNANHNRQFSHPPLCTNVAINGKCAFNDDTIHMICFLHRNQCQYGGECRNIDDKKHNQEFEHPNYCSDGGKCQNMEEDHLKQYRHLPMCVQRQQCLDFKKHNKKHCD
jgi:uncharacterized protein (TIGR02452 family)